MDTASTGEKRIGEVVEATSTEFVAQSYELDAAPPLGTLLYVRDEGGEILGVACHARTSSIDPGRRPIARGQEDTDEHEIYRRHPELAGLLRTEFRAVILGYRRDEVIHYYLPPRPPRLHGFVFESAPPELVAFTSRLDFLSTLIATTPPAPADELAAAFLRRAGQARGTSAAHSFLVAAGKELARLLAADPARLRSVLLRMKG